MLDILAILSILSNINIVSGSFSSRPITGDDEVKPARISKAQADKRLPKITGLEGVFVTE